MSDTDNFDKDITNDGSNDTNDTNETNFVSNVDNTNSTSNTDDTANATDVSNTDVSDDVEGKKPKVTKELKGKKCGARRGDGSLCRGLAMANGRCRKHGGNARKGAAHGRYTHGRYVKTIPKELLPGYQQAMKDTDLLSLKDELCVLTARISRLMERIDEVAAPPWRRVLFGIDKVFNAGTSEQFEEELRSLREIVLKGAQAGVKQERLWGEIRELIQEKTKVAKAEWDRMNDLQAVVTIEQAITFARTLLMAVQEIVTDKVQVNEIQKRMLILLPKDA